jgi:hypothetical protein
MFTNNVCCVFCSCPSYTPQFRHGQYDLNTSDHGLTALGREQAAITAQRIAELAASDAAVSDHYGRRPVRLLRVVHSDVTRAAETAAIISKALPPNVAVEVDTLLAEGYPCIPEPAGRVEVCPPWRGFPHLFVLTRTSSSSPAPLRPHPRLFALTDAFATQPCASAVYEESARIEAAFRKYCEFLAVVAADDAR